MSHNEFTARIETLDSLLRDLVRAEQDCYYNVEKEAGSAIEDSITSLKAAIEAQQYSEYYNRESNYS